MVQLPAAGFEDAFSDILSAIGSNSKTKSSDIRPNLSTICNHSEQHGLSTHDLSRLVDLVTLPSALDTTSRAVIIKSLYPAFPVASRVVYKTVNALGNGAMKPLPSVQQGLLKWLIMVLPVLEDPASCSSLYSILFNLLDVLNLRTNLCSLLARITRRKHVKPFRIQMLQQLLQSIPRDPALEKLAQIYDQFAAEQSETSKAKAPILFPHPDPSWGDRMQSIQGLERTKALPPGMYSRPFTFSRATVKKAPEIHSVDDIAIHFEKLQPPLLELNNLEDPLLQIHSAMRLGAETEDQIDQILSPLLERYLDYSDDYESRRMDPLNKALSYARFTKILPQSVLTFFQSCLPRWDGEKDQHTILELLSYLPLSPFPGTQPINGPSPSTDTPTPLDLQSTHLAPLETALLSTTDPNNLSTLLTFYTTLLRNWTTTLLSSPPPTPIQTNTITSLTTHTTTLLLTLLTHSPHPPLPLILSHLNALPPLVHPPLSLPLPPPPPLLIYTLLFHSAPSLQTLHTTSSLLASLKRAFEPTPSTTTTTTTPPRPSLPPPHIHALNASLIDTCNLIFRSRAFHTGDAHELGALLDSTTVRPALEKYTAALDLGPWLGLGALFGLSCHSALAALSVVAMEEVEDEAERGGNRGGGERIMARHAGPVTQRSLAMLGKQGGVRVSWKEYRVLVLRWLEGVGVDGVGDLGRATMRGLGMGGPGGGRGGRESGEGVGLGS